MNNHIGFDMVVDEDGELSTKDAATVLSTSNRYHADTASSIRPAYTAFSITAADIPASQTCSPLDYHYQGVRWIKIPHSKIARRSSKVVARAM